MSGGNPPAVGEKIREIRKQRSLTLDTLSERSGVSKGMLSQIESEKVNPTVATVWKIARGLGVDLEALLKGRSEVIRIFDVLHHGDLVALDTEEDGTHLQVLSPLDLAEDLEVYLLRLDKNGALRSQAHAARSEEYLTLLEGRVRVQAGNNSSVLEAGDFIRYNCDVDHVIENLNDGPSKLHMIVRFLKSQWA
ncbi:MAG: XRE family transcriptional regulator [Spirochaetaceae bacterium]|nr:MAG: XRE family transcriptional regulator [Spirochaetaceae bacterium]